MFDMEEILKRAQAAKEHASQSLKEMQEKSAQLAEKDEAPEPPEDRAASQETERLEAQMAANTQRQVEILGQIFGGDGMAQMAVNEELMQRMVNEKVAEATALSTESLMSQMFGEDMGVIAAAMETLAMDDEDGEAEESSFGPELEQSLCDLLEETMARIEALPEPEPVPYGKDAAKWERFGILLSGILSTLNDHSLDGMDVEEHIPVLEQQVVSIVRRSWGIDGRSDLLDMIRYLTQEGYILRYRVYAEAESPEELLDEDADEDDWESTARAWRFVQRYKEQYAPEFLAGWDVGRAAMLTRWGCYLGWITENEAIGILWELSRKAAEALRSWREFAQSYLFGGLMWKLLCGDSSAASYLGYLADAATDLIAGKADNDGGQWRDFPWPAQRKIGFTV